MIGEFSYKGISSSSFNLICKSVNRPLLPALKTNVISLPGSSGIYDAGGTEYDLRNLTMKIQYLGQRTSNWTNEFYNLRSKARDIAAWLGGGIWGKLIITGEEDKYYWAKIEEDIELDVMFYSGEADIPFVCQPFAYSINDLILTGSSPININYPGTRYIDSRAPDGSLFNISFNSTGSAQFSLNGRSLTYTPSGSDIIDNVNMRVQNSNFASLTGNIDSFLSINPGINVLTYINADNVSVIFRPMYY